MSRRRKPDIQVHHTMHMIKWGCSGCKSQGQDRIIGVVVRQMGRDMVDVGLDRIDGPNGATKIRGTCPTCLNEDRKTSAEMRWDRLRDQFVEMEKSGEHERVIFPA